MATNQQQCPRCETDSKLRLRDFSDQAVAALIAWGEMDRAVLNKAICDSCYGELRDALIDRADEFNNKEPQAPADKNRIKRVG